MKKFFVLLLVMALAPLANADLTLSAPGGAAPGDTIGVSLVTTAGELVSSVVLALVTDNGGNGFPGVATPGSWNPDFTLSTDPGANGGGFGFGNGDIVAATGEADAGDSATGTLYSYTYTIDIGAALGSTINFTIEDIPAFQLFSTAFDVQGAPIAMSGTSVEVVPEPMTLCLLGLGGLFLRRRKK
jgi:hypothetical protein